ncbi:MAG: hypothetical protein HYW63_01500 [Candidatus Levybacteria bacterium]|nr:hypothetical protein [Candidatus Levybacteria bacterium]
MKKNHTTYYILLASILLAGFILILSAHPDRGLQMSLVIGLSFAYVLVGILHHLINHDLVAKIVIEYVLVASLGIATAFFVFKGGFGF